MNSRQIFLIALAFLATITACVVPGLQTSPVPLPTLTVDTERIEMMVAGTVSAVIAQTEQAQPASTPGPIIIPTTTLASASTLMPTSQSTVTPISQSQVSPSQSALTKQEDGSTLFMDDRAGYEVKLPAGWLAVRINAQEYLDVFSLGEAKNINVQQSLLSVQEENPNVFRLLAVDARAEHIQNEFVTDMRFVLDETKTISLNTDADLQAIAQKIPTSAAVFRFEIASVKIVTTVSGMKIGVIEAKSSFANTSGADVGIYQKQVFFNVKAGTQSITFTTVSDLKNTLLPVFDTMLETVSLIAK
jgi:hypothetical protein